MHLPIHGKLDPFGRQCRPQPQDQQLAKELHKDHMCASQVSQHQWSLSRNAAVLNELLHGSLHLSQLLQVQCHQVWCQITICQADLWKMRKCSVQKLKLLVQLQEWLWEDQRKAETLGHSWRDGWELLCRANYVGQNCFWFLWSFWGLAAEVQRVSCKVRTRLRKDRNHSLLQAD